MRCSANIATRLSRAQFNELEVSIPTRSLVDCITIMSEFEFSVHSGIFREGTTYLKVWRMPMARARTNSKRNTRKKVAPALGVAGVSLAMAGGASASTAGSAVDVPVQNIATLFLGEEEISDVSLSTFYVFDRENTSTSLVGF